MEISIVLPAYNEEDNIAPLFNDIVGFMRTLKIPYEVIIVDDGSQDKTNQKITELQKHFRQLKVVRHRENRGYGAALRSGFGAASKPWVFFMDSDRQFSISEITLLIDKSADADLVIGYRAHRQDHIIRLINAGLFHLAVQLLLGLHVKDIDCAFKLIKREVIEEARLESTGAIINTELLIRAKQHKRKIIEVPITHYPRLMGKPTGANLKVILRAVRELLRFKFSDHLSTQK